MKKRVFQKKVVDENGTWLISYADMMTLICCFFILMVAFANYEPIGFNKKVKEVAKHFNKDKYKTSELKLTELSEEIARHPKFEKLTKITKENGLINVSFSGTVLFKDEGYTLTGEMIPVVDALIDLIKTRDKSYKVLIEGHTSNMPINKKSLISNWHLSSLRASSVADRFEYFGFSPDNLVPIGRGSTEPVVPNQNKFGDNIKENIVLNNRVVIKILQPTEAGSNVKFGLGVYFKD